MPHRTTRFRLMEDRRQPWLVSMVMWARFLRYVPEQGIAARDLARLTGLDRKGIIAWLRRLRRWGYLQVDRDGVVRPTEGGRCAQEVWRPLTAEIEVRWEARFGKEAIESLESSLAALREQLPHCLPDYMPILQYGLFNVVRERWSAPNAEPLSLPGLLAKPFGVCARVRERIGNLLSDHGECAPVCGRTGSRARPAAARGSFERGNRDVSELP